MKLEYYIINVQLGGMNEKKFIYASTFAHTCIYVCGLW